MFGKLKIVVLILLSIMLIAGCSSSNTKQTSNASETRGSESSGTTVPEGGKESGVREPITITWMRYEHPNQALKEDAVIIGEIFKRQNVKIKLESVPQSNYEDKKKTLIATNTMPDVMLVKQEDITNFADSGIFLELTPYMDLLPNLQKVIEEKPEINKNKLDGKLYGFPLVSDFSASQSGQVPVIRVDLLEELNLDVPTTYEELYEVLKAFKAAYPDSIPFTSRAANGLTGTENLVNPIAFGFGSGYTNVNGAKIYYDPHEDAYRFGPFSEEFKDAILYLRKLYAERLLDPDYATATSQTWQEKLSSGKSFYYQDNTGFGANFNKALQEVNPNARFDLIPILAGNNGIRRAELYPGDHLAESYVINANVKNPEEIIKFFDWLYSDEGMKLTSWGIEGEHYTIVNGEYQINMEYFEQFKDAPNPYRAFDSDLGTGYLGLSLRNNGSPYLTGQAPEMTRWSEENRKSVADGLAFYMAYDPPFTEEERERLKEIRTKLDAYLAQKLDTFIMTANAMNGWDAFIEECRKLGAQEMEDIYNAALNRIER